MEAAQRRMTCRCMWLLLALDCRAGVAGLGGELDLAVGIVGGRCLAHGAWLGGKLDLPVDILGLGCLVQVALLSSQLNLSIDVLDAAVKPRLS